MTPIGFEHLVEFPRCVRHSCTLASGPSGMQSFSDDDNAYNNISASSLGVHTLRLIRQHLSTLVNLSSDYTLIFQSARQQRTQYYIDLPIYTNNFLPQAYPHCPYSLPLSLEIAQQLSTEHQ
jgi:hypothetical protein